MSHRIQDFEFSEPVTVIIMARTLTHIGRHHRGLLFARYVLKADDKDLQTVKVKPPKGQSLITYNKYKDAIAACRDLAYIEYNISQIGRMFGHDGSALASQLRFHYPDVIPFREKLRKRLGIADSIVGYIMRNCPKERENYHRIVEAAEAKTDG